MEKNSIECWDLLSFHHCIVLQAPVYSRQRMCLQLLKKVNHYFVKKKYHTPRKFLYNHSLEKIQQFSTH